MRISRRSVRDVQTTRSSRTSTGPTLERLLASHSRWAINHEVVPELVWAQLDGLGLDPERLQQDMKDPAIGRNMGEDEADAKKFRVQKTPEYFVKGRQMSTFGQEQLRQLVQEELARANP